MDGFADRPESLGEIFDSICARHVPRLKMDLQISTPLPAQELSLPGLVYWEGLIHTSGASAGAPVTGHGYLELTGYAGVLTGLSN